jgi:repressor LexA
MSTAFARNLDALMAKEGLTQQAVADIAGVSNQLVSKWLSGAVKAPRADRLDLIARRFGVRRPFDIMSEGGIDYLLGIAAETRAPYTSDTSAPLYGRIAAGTPVESLVVEDRLWCPPDVLGAHPRGFFLKVTGESMNRVLPNGCFAFVDPDAEVSSGDVAAVNVNGYDATIKRYHKMSTSVVLQAESADPAERDLVFDYSKPDTDEVTVIGRVVWRTFPVEARL